MTPTVSVVVPSFNSVDHIELTMRSILAQTYTDLEVIVSDHSSDDGTWEKLQSFASDPRVRLRQIPSGGGAPANWAAVTREASGTYLKLVCGDDVIYPTCIAEQVEVMEREPDVVLVASLRDVIDERGHPILRARGLQGLDGKMPGGAAVRHTVRAGTNVFGEPASVLLRRQTLADTGGWDDRAPYLIDQATFSRVALQGSAYALRRSLAGFRVSAGQWSVKLSREQAKHAIRFHHTVAAENPGLLSASDVRRGDRRAALMALVRRATYFYVALYVRFGTYLSRARRELSPATLD